MPPGVAQKKKRNRKRKNKEGKLTAEEMCQMPTDDLCNYIENKAINDAANALAGGASGGSGQATQSNSRGTSKIKKRVVTNPSGQTMSIEDQANLEQQIMDDINFNNQFKNQRLKHNFNFQQQVYVEGGYGLHCDERQCNYCTGTLHSTPNGDIYFSHDQNCMFNNGDEGCESENDEIYEECSQIAPQRYKGEEGAGGPQIEGEEQDLEGDREVEMLKRRLER